MESLPHDQGKQATSDWQEVARQLRRQALTLSADIDLIMAKVEFSGYDPQPGSSPSMADSLSMSLVEFRSNLESLISTGSELLRQVDWQLERLSHILAGTDGPIDNLFPLDAEGYRSPEETLILNALRARGLATIGDLVHADHDWVLSTRNLGPKRFKIIDAALDRLGLQRQPDPRQNGEP